MMSVPVLGLPDFSQPFIVESDASGVGVGAVLMQNLRPLAYFSQALAPLHRNKAVYERELMAIVLAVQKWRPYLLGRKFVVRTDQKSLKFLLEQWVIAGEYQRWMTKLLGYDFSIEYKRGLDNKVDDALSRLPPAMEFRLLSIVEGLNIAQFEAQIEGNTTLKAIRNDLLLQTKVHEGYTVRGQLLYFKRRLVLPSDSITIPLLLWEFHSSPVGGHHGALKTYQQLAREVYWEGMKARVCTFVAECEICQQAKYLSLAPGRNQHGFY